MIPSRRPERGSGRQEAGTGPLQFRLQGSSLFIWQLLVEYLPCTWH